MINNELRHALSDLSTIHKLNTIPNYSERLTSAIREYHTIKAYKIDVFYISQDFTPNLQGFTFEQMEFITRMQDIEYGNLLIRSYNELINANIDYTIIPKTYFKVIKKA